MLQIDNVLISFDIFDYFYCDLSKCHGLCCVEGDAGAPIKEEESRKIKADFELIRPFMDAKGIKAVEEQGFSVTDKDGDCVTPLIDGGACAYSVVLGGCTYCAIEMAWRKGETDFRKPTSCSLYPIRITKLGDMEALNVHRWDICESARLRGQQSDIAVYHFLRRALTDRYGEEWFEKLRYAANEYYCGRLTDTCKEG